MDLIRKAEERCDAVDSLLHVCSLSGGAAGIADLITQRSNVSDRKRTQTMLGVWPSNGMKNNVVQDYNCILTSMGMHDMLDLMVVVQNEALYKLCANKLGIESPSYSEVNQVIT